VIPGEKSLSEVRPTEPDKPFLLATDIDGTLLGDEEGEACLQVFMQNHSDSLYLAVITGRSLSSVRELIGDRRLPPPDYIGSSVGTELFACDDPNNALGQKYAARVSAEWDIEMIYTLGEGEGIRRQEFVEGQPRFQAGFYWDGQPRTLAAFHRRLADQKSCHILPSANQYIDVFPLHMGKGEMVRFLQRELGLDPARVIVAGDTGNDKEMFDTGFKGVVPVNALEELKVAACQSWHYHSSFTAGRSVIDGLCHFGFVE
jgi:sucrose-phosphate synthase